ELRYVEMADRVAQERRAEPDTDGGHLGGLDSAPELFVGVDDVVRPAATTGIDAFAERIGAAVVVEMEYRHPLRREASRQPVHDEMSARALLPGRRADEHRPVSNGACGFVQHAVEAPVLSEVERPDAPCRRAYLRERGASGLAGAPRADGREHLERF